MCAVLLAAIVCLGAVSVGASAVGAVPVTADAATLTDQHAEPEGDAGDTRDNATAVSAGETVDGTFDGEEDSDTDWYALDVEAGDYIRLNHRTGSGDGPPIELYGPTGKPLAEDDMYVDALATGARAPANGTYYVKTTVSSGMPYSITFDVASPDDFESNDQRSEATAVESDAELGAVVGENETDWYAVDLSAGETLHATLDRKQAEQALECGNDLAVDVFDEEGDRISEIDANRGEAASNRTFYCIVSSPLHTAIQRSTVDESGTYYVRVTGAGVEGFQRYDLSLSVERETLPPVVGDAVPTDPDGDGRYEDVNGNDRLDFGDVVALFANIRSDDVTDHVAAYDFNENGRIDFGDVVALFGEVVG
jgi:PKD repeat protein